MLKKWRPFWSYDVEKTERFLSKMAVEGQQLIHVNLFSRVFSFQETDCQKTEYQIVYEKSQAELSRSIQESGWETNLVEGSWKFLINNKETIKAYPVREGILKRNKIHSNVATVIALLAGTQAFILLTFMIVMSSIGDATGMDATALIGFGIPLLPSIFIISIAVYATRKLRAFEQRYFNTSIDKVKASGETIRKWRFGWRTAPDITESWLADMSLKGNHLTHVWGMRFTFTKDEGKHVAYAYDYQWKATPNYYDIHKEAGWKLIFSSPYSFNKSTIWMKEYEPGEVKPRLTYDTTEEKVLVRKVLLTSAGSIAYAALLALYIYWLYNGIYENHWSLFAKFIFGALILSISLPIIGMVRAIGYAKRMKEVM